MKLRGTKIFIYLAILSLAPCVIAQVTQDEIKELLIVQEIKNVDQRSKDLYETYYSGTEIGTLDWGKAVGESAASGICMALYQSRTAGYKNLSWMPDFVRSWYTQSFASDNVYSKIFTWQKIWRETDYAADRTAFDAFRHLFKNNYFKAAIAHFLVKNFTAMMVRNEFKSGKLL